MAQNRATSNKNQRMQEKAGEKSIPALSSNTGERDGVATPQPLKFKPSVYVPSPGELAVSTASDEIDQMEMLLRLADEGTIRLTAFEESFVHGNLKGHRELGRNRRPFTANKATKFAEILKKFKPAIEEHRAQLAHGQILEMLASWVPTPGDTTDALVDVLGRAMRMGFTGEELERAVACGGGEAQVLIDADLRRKGHLQPVTRGEYVAMRAASPEPTPVQACQPSDRATLLARMDAVDSMQAQSGQLGLTTRNELRVLHAACEAVFDDSAALAVALDDYERAYETFAETFQAGRVQKTQAPVSLSQSA